jgi:hypothetical protein
MTSQSTLLLCAYVAAVLLLAMPMGRWLGVVAVYALQRLQGALPLNPQGFAAVAPDSAFNTAVSFVTNTNWQGYAGESTLTHRQLLREVWGPGSVEHSHYLRIYLGHLRRKLESDPARPAHFLTKTGVGYHFVAQPFTTNAPQTSPTTPPPPTAP